MKSGDSIAVLEVAVGVNEVNLGEERVAAKPVIWEPCE